jgi:hypothetical protein
MDVSTPVYNSWLSEAVFKAAFFIGVDNGTELYAAGIFYIPLLQPCSCCKIEVFLLKTWTSAPVA